MDKRIGADSEQTRIDLMKLRRMMWEQKPDAFIHLYGYPCRCKDTLSTITSDMPTCAKCGKVQVD
jgi:hypothetical protein